MKSFLGKAWNYVMGTRNRVMMSPSLIYLTRERKVETTYFDYIRLATLELICDEIKRNQLEGNIAEVGVYKGKFAAHINAYLPNKSFYLFDTFEGFNKKDKTTELENRYSDAGQDFSSTSTDSVLARMPHKEQCIIKKGFFPDTAEGLTDQFCFVSLDADLYDPIYLGLHFFYPKLVSGGYIMVHDFNNDSYKGVRKAVEKFCEEAKVNFVPLPDKSGTCILCKG
ncbi:methyltransferase [Taibaiella sp. KBW10]|uniref:TylF/MycF/NovP-related O-methyltransferase n=1 Tax=Taibaiella sp. KBW10 TaxID=2153357 RepID=UPI000F59CBF6|nr:TylF/MycF/NovP-related O-methyltransferase [Taibaiella sp. KBW10]RQO31766.1 methyltransferase [Taibaiella sp. KBW10]